MNQDNHNIDSPVLKSAWLRYAEFDANALTANRQRAIIQQSALVVATLSVLLAVFTNNYAAYLPLWLPHIAEGVLRVGEVFHIALILTLIISFLLLVYVIRSQQNDNSQELRAASEEIKKEIYLYRTLLQWHDDRDQWLSRRLTEIQQQAAKTFGSDLIRKPYTGELPPYYNPQNPNSDPGFTRLMPASYLRYRLDAQLEYYSNRLSLPQQARKQLYIGLFASVLIGMLFAILGGGFSAWVAVILFFAIAWMNWLEPREIDAKINSYNQLILGLQTIKDHWQSLSPDEKTGNEFFKMVIATEEAIWSRYGKHSSELWRAVEGLEEQKRIDILDEVMLLPASTAIFEPQAMTALESTSRAEVDVIVGEVDLPPEKKETLPREAELAEETATEDGVDATNTGTKEKTLAIADDIEIVTAQHSNGHSKRGLPHAFVVMPFGRKQGAEGRWYDFNAIYSDLIKPALEAAGFESFRADEESVSGDILTDMFQELLLADLVIADLSIDNANVFYELGVRHAMRKRGLVHIQSGRAYMPFDIFNVRTIPYQTDKNGRPDPDHLEKDKQAITKIARETWASDIDRVHSPIFNLLDGLVEPDRKTLRTPLATGFWREYNEWRERVTIARRQKRIGDILLLTEEISNPLIKEEAISEAGRALRGMGRFELALQQYRMGLEINPRNTAFRREEAFHLNRLNRTDEAIVKLENLLQDNPRDTEAISFLGRIYKQMWMETWEHVTETRKRIKEAYDASHWLIKATDTYLKGYQIDQNNYYPGINALSLAVLLDYLADKNKLEDDPDVEAVRENLPKLKGAIHFALESITQRDATDYWALVSLAELEVSISDDPIRVTRAYKKALTAARKNIYNLKSSLGQLELLRSISFRPQFVQAGIDVLQGEINRISLEEESDEASSGPQEPPQVFVFAGHTIDRPGQREAIFPAAMEKEVRKRIDEALDKFKADRNDLAFTTGASAGGDIIFIEACLNRNMRVEIHLPYAEPRHIQEWISFAGDQWIERYYTIRNNQNVSIRQQTDHLGPVKAGDNVTQRNERWTLYSSLIYGIDRMRLILLWDGVVDDVPGGPDHMLEEVRHIGGIAEHLNTTKFDYWKAGGKVSKALDQLVNI